MVKTTLRGVHDLESSSYGFGAQDGALGARVSFGTQSYVYIGLRVTFGYKFEDSLDTVKTLLLKLLGS